MQPNICKQCGKEFPVTYVQIGNICLCEFCWKKLYPYCHSCGRKFTLDMPVYYYSNAEHQMFAYCEGCSHHDTCCTCNLPIPTGHKKIHDKDIFCSECFAALLNFSTNNLMDCWKNVCFFFEDKFHFTCRSPIPEILSKRKLAQTAGLSMPNQEAGLYKSSYIKKIGLFNLFSPQLSFNGCQIYLLRGLSIEHSEEVLAHEVGHDFLDSFFPLFENKLLSEGFSQYIASEYNLYYGRTLRNKSIFDNPDPIYGDGARLMRDWAMQYNGVMGILKYLEKIYNGKS